MLQFGGCPRSRSRCLHPRPQTSEGMFFLASASPDENDNATEEVKNEHRGVVKLRLIFASLFFNSPADEDAKKRASSVVCSLFAAKIRGSGLSRPDFEYVC